MDGTQKEGVVTIGLREVQIASIRINPNNPRKTITQGMIDVLAASLQTVGQRTPIKLRLLSDEDQKTDPNHLYELIGGHIRLAAAQKLGWETLQAIVFDLTPEQALLEAILDNRGQEMTWLDEYLSIEAMLKVNPSLTQRDLADQLEMSLASINRGLKLLKALNQASRSILVQSLNKTEDSWQVTENPVYRLTDLEDPEKVEKALKVLIERQMTEPQAAKLMNWVKAGNPPETFGAEGQPKSQPDDPFAADWESLPDYIRVTKGKKGYEVRASLAPSEVKVGVYGLMSNLEHLREQAGEGKQTQFRGRLKAVHHEAVKLRAGEKAAQAKREADLQALQLSKEQAVQEKAQAKEQAKTEKAAAREQAKAQKAKAQPDSQPAAPGNLPPVESVPATGESKSTGFLGKAAQAIGDKVGLTDGTLGSRVTDALVNDAESAVNSLIKQGAKKLFRGLLNQ